MVVEKMMMKKLTYHALLTGLCIAGLDVTPALAADADETPPASSVWDSFIGGVSAQAFASGYYMFNAHLNPGSYNLIGYPYTQNQGFGLNFAGLDTAYEGESFGATINLRFGPGAPLLTPIAPLKQAYATWKPSGSVSLDLGFFDTIFGAEVADEWANVNFSRGALYFNRQPFNHMGLRASIAAGENTGLAFFIANGATGASSLGGLPVDDNEVPSVGAQVSFSSGAMFLAIGYMGGPNGTNGNERFGHFIDIVNTYTFGETSIVLNLDVTVDPEPAADTDLALLYGGSLALSFGLTETTSFGVRGEFLGSNDEGGPEDYFVTVTGTLRYKPIDQLIISIEPRAEFSDQPFFIVGPGEENEKWYFGAIVGVTAVIGT